MPNTTRLLRTYRALPLALILACAPGVTDATKTAALFSANATPAANAVVATVASPTPSVIVKNNGGHPVQGIAVTFAVTGGGGSVTGASVLTDKNGVASVGSWKYGTLVGANQLSATLDGSSTAPVVFKVSTKAGAAASVTKVNDGQAAPVGEQLPLPVAVVVKDAYGNIVSGAAVGFTTNSGSVNPASASTDANGRAQTQWTLGSTPGAATLTATIGSFAPVNFAATATQALPFEVVKANDNQTGTVGTALANAASVTVKDKYHNPVSGVVVQFAASGDGEVSQSQAMTDAQGVASTQWKLPTLAGSATLSATAGSLAPVSFSATAKAGAPAEIIASAVPSTDTVFTPVGDSVSVVVKDIYHNLVENTSVSFAPSTGGAASPASASTNASGVAKSKWTLPKLAGIASLVASVNGKSATFEVTAVAGAPVTMTMTGGESQTDTVAHPLGSPVVVTVKDAWGNLVGGTEVKFTPAGTQASANPATASTNLSGQASTIWTLPTGAGATTMAVATVQGSASALAHATAVADAPAQITKRGGDAQTGNAGSALNDQLMVAVADRFGNAVYNATVNFTPDAGSASPASMTTAVDGGAQTIWTLGSNAGTQSMTVTSGNAPAAIFTATAIAVNNDPCSAKGTLILGGAPVSGDLSQSTCAFGTRGALIDLWSFGLSNSTPVTISYSSNFYDTFGVMYRGQYSGQNNVVASNDDNGADLTTNSVIHILGGSGQFLVGATTLDGFGAYQMSATAWDGGMDGCYYRSYNFALGGINSTTSQTLSGTDCTAADAERTSLGVRLADRIMVHLEAGQTLTATMSSTAFDAKLELDAFNAGWVLTAQDDNGAGGTNAKLVFTAPATDDYMLYATSATTRSTGAYTLSLSIPLGTAMTAARTSTRSTSTSTTSLPAAGTASRSMIDAFNSKQK